MTNIFTADIGLTHYLVLSSTLFVIGLYGVLTNRNVIRVLICVEMMLNAVNINLAAFNNFTQPIALFSNQPALAGQAFAIFVLVVSAAEAAVGLAIVIGLYRLRSTVDINRFTELKG